MKLQIKYMVCIRCKMAVKAALNELNIPYGTIELGEISTINDLKDEQQLALKQLLLKSGLELMDDKKALLIEHIKDAVAEMVEHEEGFLKIKHSNLISQKLGYKYAYLSNLFSKTTGTTIERYIIAHKIEKVKEYLLYEGNNLTEIAYKLQYSSVAHLCAQFKKSTGLTPTFFIKLKRKKRIPHK